MINIDPNSKKPIYIQVYEGFVKLMISGAVKENEKIPSVREMASLIRINPNTIQKAYKMLESENFIYSAPGKGNFVSQKKHVMKIEIEKAKNQFQEAAEKLKTLGIENSEIISILEEKLKGEDKI